MPTPYERPATLPAGSPYGAEQSRPPLVRPRDRRWVAGVASGVADHLGVPVLAVRFVFVLLAGIAGSGFAAYVFLWAMTPVATTTRPPSGAAEERSESSNVLLIGAVVGVLGLLWAAQLVGVNLRLGFLVPMLAIALGAVVAWSQLDEAQRGEWLSSDTSGRARTITRLALGTALAVVGIVVVASRGKSLAAIWDVTLAAVAVLGGVVIIAAPWGVRFWAQLRREQAATARATERADIAAHLHDSVLQTLALIQRKAGDPTVVTQLARAQERELRSWLYAAPSGTESTLAAAVAAAAYEVEDLHGTPVELVVTGDRPLDDGGQALVRALREAMWNAVRHGAPPVSAFVEIGPAGVEAFVRDHGEGFEVGDVPEDRLGVRESILGRMTRHGGGARIRRLETGTEVELTLPPPASPATEAAGAAAAPASGADSAPMSGAAPAQPGGPR